MESIFKVLKVRQNTLRRMPVLVLLGENEFAFDIRKAERRARKCIQYLELEIVKDASHLIPVSKPEYINNRIMGFLED